MKQKLKFLLLILILVAPDIYAQTTTTVDNPTEINNENTTQQNAPSTSNDIPTLQNRIFRLQNQLSDLNVYLSGLQVRLNNLINGDTGKEMPLDEKQTQVQNLQQELMSTDTKLKEAKTELDRLSQEISKLENTPNQIPNSAVNPIESEDINNQDIAKSLQNLENRISQLETKMKSMIGAKEDNTPSITQDMQSTQKDLEDSLASEIQEGQMSVTNDNQTIKVKLNGNILFREAEVSISPEGEEALRKIVPTIKNLKDKIVMVVGHADSKPIGKNLSDFYPTNWELSTTRGAMVVRYLTEELGVNPTLLMAAGRSFYEPSTDGNDRRTEIWIFPKLPVANSPVN